MVESTKTLVMKKAISTNDIGLQKNKSPSRKNDSGSIASSENESAFGDEKTHKT